METYYAELNFSCSILSYEYEKLTVVSVPKLFV
jgi:hypothetical protein